ncbi:CDP-glucose 4,6-dehydratase [Geobacter sp. DSM 9736]|uniref:CDP-glucose 4,6-dehydratase n=1 Tax=Geobacter sp. DSM 9736 TaxID=1277350 RepID=UPI000B50DF79|nr:CDP-glucose 4,6-dehydratase [Geobacter sp. DSM 9736]SNB45027.1 CDP-glucose 4,6-dehydratase [Geobacter sp. DSM 9736]
MLDKAFWNNRKVFVTGHTGFKGAWLSLWLHRMGAVVTGYALHPPTNPNLFELARVGEVVDSVIADVRDGEAVGKAMISAAPDVVIHMAAQPLVRDSYVNPAETYAINVMGTVNVFEAVRRCRSVKAIINVTTDKCYENREWVWGYRENEPMGGYDPYSSSKACSELVTAAYRNSFFNPRDFSSHGVAVASARAGNVIGGGDWAADRLVPDCVRALLQGEKLVLRNPEAVRPWQHVLEPLSGYLLLAQHLVEGGARYGEAWNFGPRDEDARPVEWIAQTLCASWGNGATYEVDSGQHPHEAHYLKLDCSKAGGKLGWNPRWDLAKSLDLIVDWTKAYQRNEDMRDVCLRQISEYDAE